MSTASPYVVRAGQLLALRDAEVIREEARAEAATLRRQALAEIEALRRAERSAAAAEAARLVTAAQKTADDFLAAREAELADLAFLIAGRIIAGLPRDDRLIGLVRTALAEHRDRTRLRLRASPAVAVSLRAALDGLEVQEDPTLGAEDCVLLHPAGRTELGAVAQLRALLAAA